MADLNILFSFDSTISAHIEITFTFERLLQLALPIHFSERT